MGKIDSKFHPPILELVNLTMENCQGKIGTAGYFKGAEIKIKNLKLNNYPATLFGDHFVSYPKKLWFILS
jgi:hypothetical protein